MGAASTKPAGRCSRPSACHTEKQVRLKVAVSPRHVLTPITPSAGKYCGILAALVVLWRLAAFAGMHLRVAFL